MKKAVFFLTLFFIGVLCFTLFLFTDQIISLCLTEQYGLFVKVSRVTCSRIGFFDFGKLEIGPTKEDVWFQAGSGRILLDPAKHGWNNLYFELDQVLPGKALMEKSKYLTSWAGGGEPSLLALDRVKVFFHQDPKGLNFFISQASSKFLNLVGQIRLGPDGELRKMDIRTAAAPKILDIIPKKTLEGLSMLKSTWRTAILSFSGNTWTLRGKQGPLFQFSGNLNPNSR